MRTDLHRTKERREVVGEAQVKTEPLTFGVEFRNGMEFEEARHDALPANTSVVTIATVVVIANLLGAASNSCLRSRFTLALAPLAASLRRCGR
jgi:hypothetical protein